MAEFSADIATIQGRIRLEIGDDVVGKGVRPNDVNFDADALLLFYTAEGGDETADPVTTFVGRAAAKACEVLARQWAGQPTTSKMGPSSDSMNPSIYYAKQAQELRKQYGRHVPLPQPRLIPSGHTGITVIPGGAYS